ncbi:FHA domain-containing protein [Microcella daejeonensis]|uniref:FHA domain-containing protein n=1 Tax=Microcella daejeonensis TaxID=2994971 RepID=A0A9E8MK13_9MICO|nr:zinc-ribbon domain-containing protein [Microcella daejeonensis]WAB80969.1 FHA domain-containing protein [Microcella daejeonensis]
MICRHCGATLPPIAMFCGECGRSVAARTPVVPPVVLTAAAPVFSAGEVLSITPATPPEAPEDDPSEPQADAPPPSSVSNAAGDPAAGAAVDAPASAPAAAHASAHASAPAPAPAPAVADAVEAAAPSARGTAAAAPPPVCVSCGTVGEQEDLFCAECGAPMPQDTRVIERLVAPAPPAEPRAPEIAPAAAPSTPEPTPDPAAAPPAPEPAAAPPAPEPAAAGPAPETVAPLPSWASLLTGSAAPASSGPLASSTAASSVVVPGRGTAEPASTPAAPAPARAVPEAAAPPVVPDAAAAPLAPGIERSADRGSVRATPPLAPPPRLDPDVESTRLVPRSASGARFVLQFSTGESYTVVGSGLIGRNPRSEPGEAVDHLVTIVDPGRSVSKTHLEFGQDSGVFFISDRHSGNGTIIREPGAEPRYAEPGRRYRVVRGTRVDLGEQFVVIS